MNMPTISLPIDDPYFNQPNQPDLSTTTTQDQCTSDLTRALFPSYIKPGLKKKTAKYLFARMHDITIAAYFKHLILYHDGRFARHSRFRYFASNIEIENRALQTTQYVVKNSEDG